jgi:hypothetical protein
MPRRLAIFASLALVGCTSKSEPRAVQIAATATAIDETTVQILFTQPLDPASVNASLMHIILPFARPIAELAVRSAFADGAMLTLKTDTQHGGMLYAVNVGGVRFVGVARADFSPQVNFLGYGKTTVNVLVDGRGYVTPPEVDLLVTINPNSGAFSEQVQKLTMTKNGDIFTATVSAVIDPQQIYAARAITPDGAEAGRLTRFAVTSSASVHVLLAPMLPKIPEFQPPIDTTPGDGFAPVRIVLDDRPARELRHPQVRSSLDMTGHFDASLMRVDNVRLVPGHGRVYDTIIQVAVDPKRTLDGTTPDTFPYVAFLVESGEDIQQRGATFTMQTETPQVVVIPIGNPDLVPVRFRIEVGKSYLRPDLSMRGVYPGEGIFLTGEFPSAEDALGRLAADAFSGGERTTLEMYQRPDAPAIYEKTVFMPPNRPYGWKVVRCPTGLGCATLNRLVVSSGHAFPTVSKNLVDQNLDAAQNPTVKLLDPANLGDYAHAQISTTGHDAPSTSWMFKQEMPDIVVTVGTTPVTTPTYVVGTWRDVNLPETPSQIIMGGMVLNLAMYDYDNGTRGRFPPIRDITLPDDPGPPMKVPGDPPFNATDGSADTSATEISAPQGRLPIWVGWNGRDLYVATGPAIPGEDHFVIVCLEAPDSTRAAFWNKAGNAAACPHQAFLAMEGDGRFQAWFIRGNVGNNDVQINVAGQSSGQGSVLEGAIDPITTGVGPVGTSVWVAAVSYGTHDADPLIASTQDPMGNGDGNVDVSEFIQVQLAMVRAQ